jgi:hypothetical protein
VTDDEIEGFLPKEGGKFPTSSKYAIRPCQSNGPKLVDIGVMVQQLLP